MIIDLLKPAGPVKTTWKRAFCKKTYPIYKTSQKSAGQTIFLMKNSRNFLFQLAPLRLITTLNSTAFRSA